MKGWSIIMTINIYLSNLARYTEGRENGRWLTLPMESAQLEKVFAEIVGQNQEHIILDYNAPFEISEYEDILALNEFMEQMNNIFDESELKDNPNKSNGLPYRKNTEPPYILYMTIAGVLIGMIAIRMVKEMKKIEKK